MLRRFRTLTFAPGFFLPFTDDMTPSNLIRRSLLHYWRTNLAVMAGVAIAVSVLAGALLVGDSVRGSLKELFLGRLGRASFVLSASHFFPEDLPSRIERQPDFPERFKRLCPLIVTPGSCHPSGKPATCFGGPGLRR